MTRHHHHHYHYDIKGAILNILCIVLFIGMLIKLWYIVVPFVLVSALLVSAVRDPEVRRRLTKAPVAPATPVGDVPQAHYSDRR